MAKLYQLNNLIHLNRSSLNNASTQGGNKNTEMVKKSPHQPYGIPLLMITLKRRATTSKYKRFCCLECDIEKKQDNVRLCDQCSVTCRNFVISET